MRRCVEVYRAPRTLKLRHLTWNWNADGTLAGIFQLEVTLRLDRHGNVYSGTYVSDSFDWSNDVIPELHAEGIVKGSRIKVD